MQIDMCSLVIHVCHDKHLIYDFIRDWSWYSLSHVLHVIVILVIEWYYIRPYYLLISVLFSTFYSSIVVWTHVICMCTFPHFIHSLGVFLLPWICRSRSRDTSYAEQVSEEIVCWEFGASFSWSPGFLGIVHVFLCILLFLFILYSLDSTLCYLNYS